MTAAELAVIAALGAAALTGIASLGVMWLQQHLQDKSADRHAIVGAIPEVLARSMSVSMRANTIGEARNYAPGWAKASM